MENMNLHERYIFRSAVLEDSKELAEMEKICFAENEVCSYEHVKDRVEKAAEDFLIVFDQVNKKIAGFLSGIHSDSESFSDEFFTNASLQKKGGKNCFLLSLEIRPEYRRKGIASRLMERYQDREKERGTEKIYLTCHKHLLPFYERFGYEHLGTSPSTWGGVEWEGMVYTIERA